MGFYALYPENDALERESIFFCSRFVVGLAMGINFVLIPVYLKEMSPEIVKDKNAYQNIWHYDEDDKLA